jgi:hypothetical protein
VSTVSVLAGVGMIVFSVGAGNGEGFISGWGSVADGGIVSVGAAVVGAGFGVASLTDTVQATSVKVLNIIIGAIQLFPDGIFLYIPVVIR